MRRRRRVGAAAGVSALIEAVGAQSSGSGSRPVGPEVSLVWEIGDNADQHECLGLESATVRACHVLLGSFQGALVSLVRLAYQDSLCHSPYTNHSLQTTLTVDSVLIPANFTLASIPDPASSIKARLPFPAGTSSLIVDPP
jgi:hypothetical protein